MDTQPTEKKEEPKTFLALLEETFSDLEVMKAEDKKFEEYKGKFSIKDEHTAAWALGKLNMWQNEVARRKAQAEEYIRDAELMVKRLEWLFRDQLEFWAKNNLPKDKKSVVLKSGKLQFRNIKEKLEVQDEPKLKDWAAVHCPEAIVPEERVVLGPLYAHYEKTKEVPEGCRLIESHDKFDYK